MVIMMMVGGCYAPKLVRTQVVSTLFPFSLCHLAPIGLFHPLSPFAKKYKQYTTINYLNAWIFIMGD